MVNKFSQRLTVFFLLSTKAFTQKDTAYVDTFLFKWNTIIAYVGKKQNIEVKLTVEEFKLINTNYLLNSIIM